VLSGMLCRSDLAHFLGMLPAGARRPVAPWGRSRERQAA
jgi:hypothetical protein